MNLRELTGWAFDLDGVIWAGAEAMPGAVDLIAALRRTGRRVVFVTNNSMASPEGMARRLRGHGISAEGRDVVSPVGTAGACLRERMGPVRVLAVGISALMEGLRQAGHSLVTDPEAADAVVFGRDLAWDYDRLAAVCRAVDRGVPFLVMNNDPRMPAEGGGWLPGLGSIVASVVAATGREPEVVGKPSPILFRAAIARLKAEPGRCVMVGDTPAADVAGGQAAGMWTIQVGGAAPQPEPDLQVADPAELLAMLRAAEGGIRAQVG